MCTSSRQYAGINLNGMSTSCQIVFKSASLVPSFSKGGAWVVRQNRFIHNKFHHRLWHYSTNHPCPSFGKGGDNALLFGNMRTFISFMLIATTARFPANHLMLNVLQNEPFRLPKRAVLAAETGHIAAQNGPFRGAT